MKKKNIMDQIVAYSPEKLNFTFHCLDGDLYTYNNVVMNMMNIQKDIATEEITNSCDVPFERRIVAAAIILHQFEHQYEKAKLAFFEAVGFSDHSIDTKSLIEIIRFVQFVGWNHNPDNPKILCPMDQTLYNLIQQYDNCLIRADFLENLDPQFSSKNHEIEVLYKYYKITHGDSSHLYKLQNMIEYLTVDENPELIKALLDIKAAGEFRAECARDPIYF